MSWSTNNTDSFSDEHIQFFERMHAALSTVIRLHTNDLVMKIEVAEWTLELKVSNQQLEEANKRVTQQSAPQLENFACMSHEIRTPLHCIVGLSSLLQESELCAVQKESIQIITQSAELLAIIIDDVLSYSKLESGNVDIDIKRTSLEHTVMTVVYLMGSRIESGILSCVLSVLRTSLRLWKRIAVASSRCYTTWSVTPSSLATKAELLI